jgi:hypothetical protein
MRPPRHQLAPEQQHAEEGRLEEECGQSLIGEQRTDNVGSGVGVTAPVCANLERHDDPGDDAHAERHRKNLDPKRREAKIDFAPGNKIEALQDRNESGETDGEGR